MKVSSAHRILMMFVVVLLGCKTETKVPTHQEIIDSTGYEYELDDRSYKDLNLSKNGLKILMQVPEQTEGDRGQLEMRVERPQYNSWHVKYGADFEFFIIDYGIEKDLIEIKREELRDNDFFLINYDVETDSLLVYNRKVNYRSQALNDSSDTKSSYHVYQLKNIGGYNYVFKSPESGVTKSQLKTLLHSFGTVQKPFVQLGCFLLVTSESITVKARSFFRRQILGSWLCNHC